MKFKVKSVMAFMLSAILLLTVGCAQKVDIGFKNSLPKDSDVSYINEITEDMITDISDGINSENMQVDPNNDSDNTSNDFSEGGGNSFGSDSETLRFKYPLSLGMTNDVSPTFRWTEVSNATYKLNVQEYSENKWKTVIDVSGLTGTSYKNGSVMKSGGIYRAIVTAVTTNGEIQCIEAVNDGLLFMNYIDPKTHPANDGIDYTFKNKISEKVLNNYLDRAVTCELLNRSDDGFSLEEQGRNRIRAILNMGVKYVSRTYGSFKVSADTLSLSNTSLVKQLIDEAHDIDPQIIFEAGIFETVSESVDKIPIPDWVFKAFGRTPENRNFSYEKMLFPDGKGVNQHGSGLHTPDITQLETQMHFYHLACTYIDLGFEAFHMGQTALVGANDKDYECYSKLFSMIRSYAKQNARRGMVLINSHNSTVPMKNASGVFLIDFLAEPAAIYDIAGTAHLPSENNPQKAEIRSNSGVWTRKYSGVTPSGWYATNLPCYAEFDNWMSVPESNNALMNPTGRVDVPWGMDEISWFANQPASYRHSFIDYIYKKAKSFNENAHICFPISRPIYSIKKSEMTYYYAASSVFSSSGFDDEEVIKATYIRGRG